ncbi:MAG TPA: DUF1028 domain-containing protein [Methylomirabilota bacterium]|nr:DUF1028 domain-containing protein [Methylomirabilota bacterium]
MKQGWILLLVLCVAGAMFAESPGGSHNVSTFSIVARDPATGQMGIAVASRYFSVGSVVPWAMADVGAVATQANVNVGYGPKAMDLLRQGLSADEVAKRLLDEDTYPGKDGRQFAIVDAKGGVVTYTGPNAPNWAGGQKGANWAAQGNILVGPQVPEAMGKAFEATSGELAEKMFAALKAGDAAGGDKRGRQSASMLIVCRECGRNTNNDRYLYINVDDSPDPFMELRRLLDVGLAYNYGDRAAKLLGQKKIPEARQSAQTAVKYAPNSPDAHMSLGMLNYLSGDKAAALSELQTAQRLDPNFRKQWDAMMGFAKDFAVIQNDKEFMAKLFPSTQ